jgi:hypothetical protein
MEPRRRDGRRSGWLRSSPLAATRRDRARVVSTVTRDQFCGQCRRSIISAIRRPQFDRDVPAVDVACFAQALAVGGLHQGESYLRPRGARSPASPAAAPTPTAAKPPRCPPSRPLDVSSAKPTTGRDVRKRAVGESCTFIRSAFSYRRARLCMKPREFHELQVRTQPEHCLSNRRGPAPPVV